MQAWQEMEIKNRLGIENGFGMYGDLEISQGDLAGSLLGREGTGVALVSSEGDEQRSVLLFPSLCRGWYLESCGRTLGPGPECSEA